MKTLKSNRMKELGLAFGIGFGLALAAFSGVTYWLNRHTVIVRSPIVIQNKDVITPLPTKKLAPTLAPTGSPKKPSKGSSRLIPQVMASDTTMDIKVSDKQAMVNASKYPDFIDHIWEHESGRGSNTSGLAGTCLAKDMSNEFGFYPQGKWCFDNFQKAVERIELWREHEAKGLTDNQALCYYNSGVKVETCAYLGYNFEDMN